MNHQQKNLLVVLARKSQQAATAGGDGFISADSLRFDVGLSTQAIRRYLDAAAAMGAVEHRQVSIGQRHAYKPVEASCS